MRSTFRHIIPTLSDNSLFWKMVDFLKKNLYIVEYDMPNVISGNNILFDVRPYPKPDDLQFIKEIISQIEKKAKKK